MVEEIILVSLRKELFLRREKFILIRTDSEKKSFHVAAVDEKMEYFGTVVEENCFLCRAAAEYVV